MRSMLPILNKGIYRGVFPQWPPLLPQSARRATPKGTLVMLIGR